MSETDKQSNKQTDRQTDKRTNKKQKMRNAFSGETKFMEVNKGDELTHSMDRAWKINKKKLRKNRLEMEWG